MTYPINIEDLRIGSVVELVPATVRQIEGPYIQVSLPDNLNLSVTSKGIARIIPIPETDAEKIARLERERDEALVQIAELEAIIDRYLN